MRDESLTLNQLVGRNVRRIRQERGQTLDEVARRGRDLGFKWSTSRIVELEAGKLPVSLQVLIGLCWVLGGRGKSALRLADLLEGHDGFVNLAGQNLVDIGTFLDAVSGKAISIWDAIEHEQKRVDAEMGVEARTVFSDAPAGVSLHQLRVAEEGLTLADERAAKKLNMTTEAFLAYSFLLWGHSMSDERDAVAYGSGSKFGSGARLADDSPQALGIITRRLVNEIVKLRNSMSHG